LQGWAKNIGNKKKKKKKRRGGRKSPMDPPFLILGVRMYGKLIYLLKIKNGQGMGRLGGCPTEKNKRGRERLSGIKKKGPCWKKIHLIKKGQNSKKGQSMGVYLGSSWGDRVE